MRLFRKKCLSLVLIALIAVLLTGCASMPQILSYLLPVDYIEVTVDEATFENKFYYAKLSEEERLIYREVYQGLREQLAEFHVHSADGEQVNAILYEVLFDFPELFWSDGEVVSTAYLDTYVTVEPAYNCSVEAKKQKQAEVEMATKTILASVPGNISEYEKIKYVYEYIVNSVEYVEGAPDNQNIYSSLVGKASVCAGYAKATQYLLEKLGIYSIYVTGMAQNVGKEELHAWNIVRCDDKYYYVDTTWADPLFAAQEEQVQEENLVYDYLCCDKGTLANTHKLDENYSYPACDSDDLNYYRLNNMYYEAADRNAILNAMKGTINAQENSTIFKFSGTDIYQQAKDLIVNDLLQTATNYLGRKYRLNEVTCYYREDEQLNKFTVYWKYN